GEDAGATGEGGDGPRTVGAADQEDDAVGLAPTSVQQGDLLARAEAGVGGLVLRPASGHEGLEARAEVVQRTIRSQARRVLLHEGQLLFEAQSRDVRAQQVLQLLFELPLLHHVASYGVAALDASLGVAGPDFWKSDAFTSVSVQLFPAPPGPALRRMLW